jgi:hypothetical protein
MKKIVALVIGLMFGLATVSFAKPEDIRPKIPDIPVSVPPTQPVSTDTYKPPPQAPPETPKVPNTPIPTK